MKTLCWYAKLFLAAHLFILFTWLYLFREHDYTPVWMVHLGILSILAIQFTWGYTIGLIVGPARKDRGRLWWSLLTLILPMWIVGPIVSIVHCLSGPLIAAVYLSVFAMILASETFCGVLLGAKSHSGLVKD